MTATEPPIDGKNNVKPVTITITVTNGSTADIDVKAKAEEGINSAVTYITEKHSTDGYAYGDEWLIYALLRNGVEISSDVQDAYYQSAAAEVKKWNADQKPDRHRACCPDTYGNGQRYHRCGRYRSGIHDLPIPKS